MSTFGVVFDPERGRFDWTKFRAMARLHKKTDESLEKYLYAFMSMCRRVCRLPSKEGGCKYFYFVLSLTSVASAYLEEAFFHVFQNKNGAEGNKETCEVQN